MNDITVSKRIYLVSSFLIISTFILSLFSIYNFDRVSDRTDYLKSNVIKQILVASEMKIAVIQVQQWLTDVSATRGAEGFDDGFPEAENWAKTYREKSKFFREITKDNPKLQEQINVLDTVFEDYYKLGKEMATTYVKFGPTEGNKFMEKFDPTAEKMTNELEKINNAVTAPIEAQFYKISYMIDRAELILKIISGIVLLISLIFVYFNLKKIKATLSSGLTNLKSSSDVVHKSSQENLSLSEKLSQSVHEQAASIQEIASTSEEITQMAKRNQELVYSASSEAQLQMNMANETSRIINELNFEINKLSEINQGIVHSTEMNARKLESVYSIFDELKGKTKVIDDIVFQTKLLSFNASVEASRAGENGKGFAVVAEEVGKLAAVSGEASKSINTMIQDSSEKIKGATSEVVNTITNEIERTKIQMSKIERFLEQNVEIIKKIQDKSHEVKNLLSSVETASKEQTTGIEQMTIALTQIEQANNENAKIAQDTSHNSKTLKKNSMEFNTTIDEINTFIG